MATQVWILITIGVSTKIRVEKVFYFQANMIQGAGMVETLVGIRLRLQKVYQRRYVIVLSLYVCPILLLYEWSNIVVLCFLGF